MNTRTRLASDYGLVGAELDAIEAGFKGIQPHPQDPRAYILTRPKAQESAKGYATCEFLLDTWTNPQSPEPIAITVSTGVDNWTLAENSAEGLAMAFLRTLRGVGEKRSVLVVWSGAGVVFHTFLRHLARPMAEDGAIIQPLVSGVDIKAIIIKHNLRQWVLCDSGAMSGLSRLGQEGFCDAFGASLHDGWTNAQRLYTAVGNFQDTLLHVAGVAIRPTIAAVALKASRYALPPDAKWFRPNLALESVCRCGGAYRGGYVYSESYNGPAWRVDVNKMYTSLLRNDLPAHSTFGHAGKYGQESPGIYLARVEGEGHFPAYLSAFSLSSGRFHKQYLTSGRAWCWLPSTECVGLRRIGYDVMLGMGFKFDSWVSLRPFAEQLIHHIMAPSSTPSVRLVCKSLGNSLTGKLGQSPERLDVSYSIAEPRGGWLPYITAEGEVVSYLWIKRHTDFKAGQHVDAAAWLTAMGRGKVYGQLARVASLGWRALHVDTDGIIVDQDPRGVLSLTQDTPGQWRYDGFDPECIVAKSKWYSFKGEVHTAGLSGVTREQLEAVQYGKRVVFARKVLVNPLGSSNAYRESYYSAGG